MARMGIQAQMAFRGSKALPESAEASLNSFCDFCLLKEVCWQKR